jgi:TetR/AcrR family transcriptional repressor of multidrug resistance operon
MNVQLESPEKKESILKSTLELIGANGFHGSPMSLIAKNAGVAAGTIYHYFPSKDTLIYALYADLKSKIKEAMFKNDDVAIPFQERFFTLFTNLCSHYIKNPNSLTFLEQYTSSPFSKCNPEHKTKNYNQDMIDFFNYGIEKGYVKQLDDHLLAPVFHGTIISTAKLHITGRYKFTNESLINVAQIIWDGIKSNKQQVL